MARATLIRINGLSRTYRTSSGKIILLEMNEDWTEIIFKLPNGEQFGEFEFKDLENGSYKLIRMYSEPYKEEGIGRAALEMFKDITDGVSLYTSPNDGIQREDQSHLTQDAPIFVAKMIKEGLIDGYENEHNLDNGFLDL